jgi:hypothetical protein
MRKKVLILIGVIVLLAVLLSVTAFAADSKLPEYNLVEVIRQNLIMSVTAFFKTIDAIYLFFAKLFGKA